MTRWLSALLALALAACSGAPASAQSLTLTNLRAPVAKLCPGVAKVTTIAAFWAQLAACGAQTEPAPPALPTLVQGTVPSWGTGQLPGIYNANEGAFRFVCGGDGPLRYDDPVVYPGKPGAAHLHQVWGNRSFDANTTTETLLASSSTNCNDTPFSLNRSSYWQPALIHDSGQVVRPDLVMIYYKRLRSVSPGCQPGGVGMCAPLPKGLKAITGWDQFAPNAPVRGAWWYCTGASGHYADLDAVFAAGCKAGDQLVADTFIPPCWDGKNTDSPDHRSHLAWPVNDRGDGIARCPSTHPKLIPQQESKVSFSVTADMIGPDHKSRIRLSSDGMLPGAKPGATLHTDYMEAWVASARDAWHTYCIEKGLDCSGGDLGNGRQLIGASEPKYGWRMPVPRDAVPAGTAGSR